MKYKLQIHVVHKRGNCPISWDGWKRLSGEKRVGITSPTSPSVFSQGKGSIFQIFPPVLGDTKEVAFLIPHYPESRQLSYSSCHPWEATGIPFTHDPVTTMNPIACLMSLLFTLSSSGTKIVSVTSSLGSPFRWNVSNSPPLPWEQLSSQLGELIVCYLLHQLY